MAEEKKVENNNLELWNSWKAVPANAMKGFDNGKFKGTDINTMWRMKVLTETFGICGFGWYYNLKRTWVEQTNNNEQFAFAEIELFIKQNGEWSMPIVGTGGNKLTRVTKNGEYSTSDEAFKMAVTDAIGVACRNLGIGADVYWENDKTKYTEVEKQKKEDDARAEEIKAQKQAKSVLKKGIQDNAGTITEEQKAKIKELVPNIDGMLTYIDVPEIDLMSYEQAQFIIDQKSKVQ